MADMSEIRKTNTVTYKVLMGLDKSYMAFRIDGRQEVALAKEKTIDALIMKLFTPGQRLELVTGEKRGFMKIGQDELVYMKEKLKKLA